MTEKITAIIFLSLLVLVPPGILAAIVSAIVKTVRTKRGFKSLARRFSGSYFPGSRGEAEGDAEYARSLLEPTLFSMRRGDHRIIQGVRGNRRGRDFLVLDYHYRSPGPNATHRLGGPYTVIVLNLPSGLPNFFLTHRKQGLLNSAAEKLAGARMGVPEDSRWDWALCSRDVPVESLGLKAESIKGLVHPGESLFVFDSLLALTRPGPADPSRAQEIIESVERIEAMFAGA